MIHLLLITLIFSYLNSQGDCLFFKRFLTWHQVNSASLQNFKYVHLWTLTYLEISFLLFLLSFNHTEFSLSFGYLAASALLLSKNTLHYIKTWSSNTDLAYRYIKTITVFFFFKNINITHANIGLSIWKYTNWNYL